MAVTHSSMRFAALTSTNYLTIAQAIKARPPNASLMLPSEDTMMRMTILATFLSVAAALPASAATIRCGDIIGVNDTARSFGCHWKKKQWTFKTTEKTVVRAGAKDASWSDMKAGQAVQVDFHQSGHERIADRVIITGMSF